MDQIFQSDDEYFIFGKKKKSPPRPYAVKGTVFSSGFIFRVFLETKIINGWLRGYKL